MRITPAEARVLDLIHTTGPAHRVHPGHSAYCWHVNGRPMSGPVDGLIRKGMLSLTEDKSQARISPRGRTIVQERKAA